MQSVVMNLFNADIVHFCCVVYQVNLDRGNSESVFSGILLQNFTVSGLFVVTLSGDLLLCTGCTHVLIETHSARVLNGFVRTTKVQL